MTSTTSSYSPSFPLSTEFLCCAPSSRAWEEFVRCKLKNSSDREFCRLQTSSGVTLSFTLHSRFLSVLSLLFTTCRPWFLRVALIVSIGGYLSFSKSLMKRSLGVKTACSSCLSLNLMIALPSERREIMLYTYFSYVAARLCALQWSWLSFKCQHRLLKAS